ncbi:MAG: DUF3386 family protein [Gemmataceae bacterium]
MARCGDGSFDDDLAADVKRSSTTPSTRAKIRRGLQPESFKLRWLAKAFLLGSILLNLAAADARGHFLFVRIGPPAEAGRAAEVYFSELARAGDPRFTEKIAPTKLWLQTRPGDWQPLETHKGSDRLRANLPVSGSLSVVGSLTYGVLARPEKTPFLLRHHPKAIAGDPDELKKFTPSDKVPIEIVAEVVGDQLRLTALRQGKPLPGAEFNTVDAKLEGKKFKADDKGQALWKPAAPGIHSVYFPNFYKEAGTHAGKKYEEVREFATLSFTWPLAAEGADPAAVKLFEDALAARSRWQDLPGFSAAIKGQVDGRPFAGTLSIDATGKVTLGTFEEVATPWAQEQLESLVLHRRASPRRGKPPVLRFADDDLNHPLGRLLLFDGGRFASSYRVKDRQILVVNRFTDDFNMTITILDNVKNADGEFLPQSYTVQYWQPRTGKLLRTETVQDRWQRVGKWDLPVEHTVTTASEAGLSVRTFRLSEHKLLE